MVIREIIHLDLSAASDPTGATREGMQNEKTDKLCSEKWHKQDMTPRRGNFRESSVLVLSVHPADYISSDGTKESQE